MEVLPTITMFIIFLIAGIISYLVGFYFLKRKHLIQNTPTSKIRSIAMGFVEIAGIVIPIDNNTVFQSPFSDQKCVIIDIQ